MRLQPLTGTREEDRCARFHTINGRTTPPHCTMKWLGVALALCALIPSAHCAAESIAWCYHLPSCNYTTWPSIATQFCNGSRQSPINIVTGSASIDNALGDFTFTKFDDPTVMDKIENTGMTIKVTLKEGVQVSGGNLPEAFDTLQFHLHWGNGVSVPGSEHTVDGKQYPMELHFVHTRSSLNKNVTAALADPQGAAALGFFIEATTADTSETGPWQNLSSYLSQIEFKGNSTTVLPGFTLNDLIGSVNRSRYWRYNGSLTTPACDEAVIWTVFKETIKIPASVIELFSNTVRINGTGSIFMREVFRGIQPDLPVTTQNDTSSSSSTRTCYSLGLMALSLVFGRM